LPDSGRLKAFVLTNADDCCWSVSGNVPFGGFLPFEESAVNDSNAQIPVVYRRLGERVKSTVCRIAAGAEIMEAVQTVPAQIGPASSSVSCR
jgi:hypothetical protein